MLVPYYCNDDNWKKMKEEMFSWLGTPCVHFQRAKGYGVDCTMFVGQCLVNVGVLRKLSYEYYSSDWHEHTESSYVEDGIYLNFRENTAIENLSFKKILYAKDDHVRGDILLFSTTKKNISNHCAVDIGNDEMIHSINHAGVVKTQYVNWWRRHTRYRIRLFEEI